jgi:flagellar assembly protein FliH
LPDGLWDAKTQGGLQAETSSGIYPGKLPENLPERDPWTEEAVSSGKAQERRLLEDRRESYRRIEDKILITKASEQAHAILENAQHEGFEQGLTDARQTLELLQQQFQVILQSREDALLDMVNEIATFAVEVAERIIKTEVTCDDGLVLALVRDTLQKAGRGHRNILIKVNPEDNHRVKQYLKELPPSNTELVVMDDASIDRGSCLIETNSGMIDANFSTQLQILRSLFKPLHVMPGHTEGRA